MTGHGTLYRVPWTGLLADHCGLEKSIQLESDQTWRMIFAVAGKSGDVRLCGRERHSTTLEVVVCRGVDDEQLDLSSD